MTTLPFTPRLPRFRLALLAMLVGIIATAAPAAADDRIYFPAVEDARQPILDAIYAETVRVDMSAWYLTDRRISVALLDRFQAGVDVRLIGDRGSIFEIDANTQDEFYWLASHGVPIRLRYYPTWYPEIAHWKGTIFVGQNLVTFGSANYTPFELVPTSSTNYKDETVLFTDDPELVNAFKTKFDQFWNDTMPEPHSLVANPPYFLNWDEACTLESACSDYATRYPNPVPMVINTARLEPDNPMPPDMVWGQGPLFNNRLVQEINAEVNFVDFVIYRLTVDSITDALLAKHQAGIPVRIILEPNEYENIKWPEFWLTHANMDKLWAAGVPIKKRIHQGLTHMKMLVTSNYATNASSNLAAAWQRDANYFVPAGTKPAIYQAMADRFDIMWNDAAGFADFTPGRPNTPVLELPANGAGEVPADASLRWNRAPFAVSYDVLFGTSPGSMTKVANVPARLVNDPPQIYFWQPDTPLAPATTYYWRIIARTNATTVDPSVVATSATRSFTTAGGSEPPGPGANPSPPDGATGVGTTPELSWSPGAPGTTFDVAFGTSNPPSPVATGVTSPSYSPGLLAESTTYYWQVTTVTGGGSTPGPVWSFTTGAGVEPATEVVLYASDVATLVGAWTTVSDPTAADGLALRNPDAGGPTIDTPMASPTDYVEASFNAVANTRYRVWLRIRPADDSKWNDSVFVQFSDSVNSGGSPIYRVGTTSGLTVNLWTCSSCQSFGWGWQRHAYWLSDTGDVWFQNSGTHTIRVQTREDGADIDQIVISPIAYADSAPGPASNDTTIVPKAGSPGPSAPGSPGSPAPPNGATAVSSTASLSWSASGATSYDVQFGTANPPPTVVSATSSASYTPPGMADNTTYHWRIVAHNDAGTTTGPLWSFTTGIPASNPPAAPGSPTPADGGMIGTTTPTLTWTADGATSYDVRFGTANPPPPVSSGQADASYSPPPLAQATTYFWQVVAHNDHGTTAGPVWSFATPAAPASDIVIYASDVPPSALHGSWATAGDPASPDGVMLATPDAGIAQTDAPLAAPVHHFDVTFTAQGGTPYTLWLRLRALNDSKFNDAVWVQFSNATVGGSPVYPMNTTSGLLVNLASSSTATSLNAWGWHHGAYWLSQPATITFPTSGPQTMRIQIREDGVRLDQIVLSPATYLNTAPGPMTDDHTTVPKPGSPGPSAPGSPGSPAPANGATGVSSTASLSWSASGATSYDVQFGTANPPPTVVSATSSASYTPPGMADNTTYHWRIVAHNDAGTTTGPLWSFTTGIPASNPPAAPGSPTPADASTIGTTNPTLTWTANGASSYDVRFGTSNPPPPVSSGQADASYTPPALTRNLTYFWQVIAHNNHGTTAGPVWSFVAPAAPAPDIVIYASDVPPSALHGSWATAGDPASPGGVMLATPDAGIAQTDAPLAAPVHYFDVAFTAEGGMPYTLWLRLRALNDSKFNDAVWVQFSDATVGGSPAYPMNTTSGLLVNLASSSAATSLNAWGWHHGAYWLSQPAMITFPTSGSQTMRIQIREDGVRLDQIVLSQSTYRNAAPGPMTNDHTIVPRP